MGSSALVEGVGGSTVSGSSLQSMTCPGWKPVVPAGCSTISSEGSSLHSTTCRGWKPLGVVPVELRRSVGLRRLSPRGAPNEHMVMRVLSIAKSVCVLRGLLDVESKASLFLVSRFAKMQEIFVIMYARAVEGLLCTSIWARYARALFRFVDCHTTKRRCGRIRRA